MWESFSQGGVRAKWPSHTRGEVNERNRAREKEMKRESDRGGDGEIGG